MTISDKQEVRYDGRKLASIEQISIKRRPAETHKGYRRLDRSEIWKYREEATGELSHSFSSTEFHSTNTTTVKNSFSRIPYEGPSRCGEAWPGQARRMGASSRRLPPRQAAAPSRRSHQISICPSTRPGDIPASVLFKVQSQIYWTASRTVFATCLGGCIIKMTIFWERVVSSEDKDAHFD